jgi:excisionase family DNA binding protein
MTMVAHCFLIKEAAGILRLSEKTVRRLIAGHALHAELIGGAWRIPRGEICRRLGCSPEVKCRVRGGSEFQLLRESRG